MVSFEVKNVEMPDLDFSKVEKWLYEVAASYNKQLRSLNYLFCDDEEILKVNREFLHHDYFTDIITFDYSYKNKVAGDIFVSIDTVRSNAEKLNLSYDMELHRVIVHGLLHLCGINDKGSDERKIMEYHEDRALGLYHLIDR